MTSEYLIPISAFRRIYVSVSLETKGTEEQHGSEVRIISKSYAVPRTMTKIPQKYQKQDTDYLCT